MCQRCIYLKVISQDRSASVFKKKRRFYLERWKKTQWQEVLLLEPGRYIVERGGGGRGSWVVNVQVCKSYVK